MGVMGLKTLMDNNPQLFQTHRLHDCSLVIDGNNIYHKIYLGAGVDCVMGGEYDAFYERAAEFFHRLRRCNIVPYVVLDGSHSDEANVLPSALRRAKKSLSSAVALSRGENSYGLLPMHASMVFCDVMRDLGIAFVRSDYAADSQVAALANEIGPPACPVLSEDSDFYVYDVRGGFIPYDNLAVDVQVKKGKGKAKPSYCYLTSRIYFLENFLNGFGEGFNLNRTTFNLFAAVTQYDIIDGLNLKPLHRLVEQRSAENSLKFNCKLSASSHNQRKLVELLFGLRSVTRLEAIDVVVINLDAKERVEAKKALQNLMLQYRPTLMLQTDLLGLDKIAAQVPITLPSFTGEPLPPWFVHRCRTGELNPFLLQVPVLRWICLYTCVEAFDLESVHGASIQLRRIIYGILLDCNSIGVSSRVSVMEVSRRREFVNSESVFPLNRLPSGKLIPRLDDLPSLTREVKRKFLAEVLLGNEAGSLDLGVPDEWQLFVWTLIFWMRATEKPVVKRVKVGECRLEFWHLDAILLSGLYYNALQNQFKIDRTTRDALEASLKKDHEEHERSNTLSDSFVALLSTAEDSKRHRCANSSLSNFTKPRTFGRSSNALDLNVIHVLAQFQSCLYYAVNLNKLLDLPVPDIRVTEFLNFVFIYNACCHLRKKWSDRDKLLVTWLGPVDSTSNPIHAFFQDLRNLIVNVTAPTARPLNMERRNQSA